MTYFDENAEYWGDKVKPIIGAANGRFTARSVKFFGDGKFTSPLANIRTLLIISRGFKNWRGRGTYQSIVSRRKPTLRSIPSNSFSNLMLTTRKLVASCALIPRP
jgi:hypothetical protein